MVTVEYIIRRWKVPRSTIYFLIDRERLPFVDVTEKWHKNRQYRFRPAEVEAVLGPPKA